MAVQKNSGSSGASLGAGSSPMMQVKYDRIMEMKKNILEERLRKEKLWVSQVEEDRKKRLGYMVGMLIVCIVLIGMIKAFGLARSSMDEALEPATVDELEEDLKGVQNPVGALVQAGSSLILVTQIVGIVAVGAAIIFMFYHLYHFIYVYDSHFGCRKTYRNYCEDAQERLQRMQRELAQHEAEMKKENTAREKIRAKQPSYQEQKQKEKESFTVNMSQVQTDSDGNLMLSLEDVMEELQTFEEEFSKNA